MILTKAGLNPSRHMLAVTSETSPLAKSDEYLTAIFLLDMLNTCPKHKKLVHGNFTPHNILVSDNGDYILELESCSPGQCQCRRSPHLYLDEDEMPEYADLYLTKFCDATNTSSKYVHNWIPIGSRKTLARRIPEKKIC